MNAAKEVTDKLNQSAWKLCGLASLFKADETGKEIRMESHEGDGFYFLLYDIANDICRNAELITEAKPTN